MGNESPKSASYESITPYFKELTQKVVLDDIWERPQLKKRDRSLIVLAALTAMGHRRPQFHGHIRKALDHGVTKEEIGEIFLQMAFYSGWPAAINAFDVAKEVFDELGI